MQIDHPETEFEISRHFKAPLALVWQAWSEAEKLGRWWGPKGVVTNILRFDFQPGGFCHYSMTVEGAPTMWGRFNYREIVPHERLVWLNSFANEHGGIARAPFSGNCPLEIQNDVTFAEADGGTTVTLRAQPFGAIEAERQFFVALRPSLEMGYGGTLEQLEHFLAATQ